MGIDDGRAYALATWARFDDEVHDDLLRAVCGAFALVAAADGSVSHEEIDRFVGVLQDSSSSFPKLDIAKVESAFRQLCQALLSDPEEGRRHVLLEVAVVKDDGRKRELVRDAAAIALLADERGREAERAVMKEINRALGSS
jgi:tellurite resistance protein